MTKVVTDQDIGTSLTIDSENKLNVNTSSQNTTYYINLQKPYVVGDTSLERNRRYVIINSLTNLGHIHLDFKRTTGGARTVGRLPAECPTPNLLMEQQFGVDARIWIEAGSRVIEAVNLENNRRYIVNLSGYFNRG